MTEPGPPAAGDPGQTISARGEFERVDNRSRLVHERLEIGVIGGVDDDGHGGLRGMCPEPVSGYSRNDIIAE